MRYSSKPKRSMRWYALALAGLLSVTAACPAAAAVDNAVMTPDTPIYYDRVDNVFPDLAKSETMLDFFQRNLIANQQPDGRFDNYPQKVYVSGNNLTAGNVTDNGGFELGAAGLPTGWTLTDGSGGPPNHVNVTWQQDTSIALEGSGYMKMTASSPGSAALMQQLNNPFHVMVDYTTPADVVLTPGSLMIFSAFYNADQASVGGNGQGIYGKVTFVNSSGQPIGSPYVFQGASGTTGWQEIRGLVSVPSVQPAGVVIQAGMDESQGTVLWDGIRLMRVDTTSGTDQIPYATKGTAAVPNAGFETSATWTPVQESGPAGVVTPSAAGGYSGNGGRIVTTSTSSVALLSNTWSASGNGTRQFGGDYRIFQLKYKTEPGFTAVDGKGVEARLVYLDQNKKQIGTESFYGGPTEGQWGTISGVFDTPYPVYSVRIELRSNHTQGTVTFDNVSYIGVDQQASSTEAGLGTLGMLAFNWAHSGKSDELLAKRTRDGLSFYLHKRVMTIDNIANASKLMPGQANSGEVYVPYSVSGATTGADYPTTAFGLHNLATAIQYGEGLFTEQQMTDAKAKALSMWNWLTRVSQFNTQQSMNQSLVAVLGGIQMANLLQDDVLKRDIRDYYASGIAGTNLPPSSGGVRKAARQNIDGYNIFYEVNGFDVSYAGVSLSDLAGIMQALPDQDAAFGDLKTLLYQDGLEMASYFNVRMSADGWIFAGSRHNEGGSSAYNMGNFSGLSYWGHALKADLGRFLIKSFASPTLTYGDTANLGHLAVHGPLQMYETIAQYPWDRTQQQKLETNSLRKGDVSAYFKSDSRQPLNISVSGTDFMESLFDTGKPDPDKPGFPKIDRLNGWFAKAADGSYQYDDSKQATTNQALPHYFVRQDDGVSSSGANTTKQYYITDGKSLYNILAVRFGTAQSYLSLGELIGLPYMSIPQRAYAPGTTELDRIRINGLYATDGMPLLDLAKDTGSISAPAFVAGSARVTGFPLLKAENAPAGGAAKPTWLSTADEGALSAGFVTTPGKVMDDLYSKALWDPTNVRSSANNGTIVQFANSDKITVQVTDSSLAANYQVGDWVYFVSKIEPNASTSGFTVKSVAKYDARTDVLRALTIEDEGMKLVLHEGHSLFVDKAGKTALVDGHSVQGADLSMLRGQLGLSLGGNPEQFPYASDINGDGQIDTADLGQLGYYMRPANNQP
ncbi:hypothetical protein LOZ80_37125 [Paenibacillus sp. HWE-109]|uniref:hypothetical protein n=1 Tax=Paenibacillus sp. HWE-109 TaxID=1306526 RepID=UPI001EDF49B5|nr:hypothetical protein [Paenibacillus sp. HWE-109]UKS27025.1 hypothetical protein LOZ80_37125 [Paenibacillus sp. HWE-109]